MKTLCTDDTLFLSTQAESIWHLKAALFGKVAIELNEIAADSIFFLPPGKSIPLSALPSVRAIICTKNNPNFEALIAEVETPVIVVSE